MRQLRYLVTGTGRCGTVYLSHLLTSVGISCGHESVFNVHGLIPALRKLTGLDKCHNSFCSNESEYPKVIENLQAESSYMAAPYLSTGLFHGGRVIHLVRNPIQVITSFSKGLRYFQSEEPTWIDKSGEVVPCEYHKFIYQFIPELAVPMDPLNRAALYYIRWNEMIEKLLPPAGVRVKLEDCPQAIFNVIGAKNPQSYYSKTDDNKSEKGKPIDLSEITDQSIQSNLVRLASRYGYFLKGML
jgi:hypothetical protein